MLRAYDIVSCVPLIHRTARPESISSQNTGSLLAMRSLLSSVRGMMHATWGVPQPTAQQLADLGPHLPYLCMHF